MATASDRSRQARCDESLAAHLRLHWTTQELTVQAALSGDRQLALEAFLLDPLLASTLDADGDRTAARRDARGQRRATSPSSRDALPTLPAAAALCILRIDLGS